jgi:hypothetical protein
MDPRDADPLVLIEDQERPLVTISDNTFEEIAGWRGISATIYPWRKQPRWRRRVAIVALVAGAFLAGFIVRAALATPRAGPTQAPSFEDVPVSTQPGVPHGMPATEGRRDDASLGMPVWHVEQQWGQDLPELRPTQATDAVASPSGIGSPLQGVQGLATWFCCTAGHPSGLYAAAGPALRVGHWRGRVVTVSSPAEPFE